MKSKKHNDATGHLRGQKGFGEAHNDYESDRDEFTSRSFDPEWDAAIYGPTARGGVPAVVDKGNYGVDGHDRADFRRTSRNDGNRG